MPHPFPILLLPLAGTDVELTSEQDFDHAWRAERRLVEPQLEALARGWTDSPARRDLGTTESTWLERYHQFKAEESNNAIQREMKLNALRGARRRLATYDHDQQICEQRRFDAEDRLRDQRSELARKVEAALEQLDGKGARKALSSWWSLWIALDWEAALSREDGLDALNRARAPLDTLVKDGTKSEKDRKTLNILLAVADQIRSDEIFLVRAQAGCASGDRDALAAEEARLVQEHSVLLARDQAIKGLLSALEASRPAMLQADGDPKLRQARELARSYARLSDGLDRLSGLVDRETWCRINVDTALAYALAGESGAEANMQAALSAYPDRCDAEMERWSEVEVFHRVWLTALDAAKSQKNVRLGVPFDDGTWTIDGTVIHGDGCEIHMLGPGHHRFEHVSVTGGRRKTNEWLASGYGFQLSLSEERLELAELEDICTEMPRPPIVEKPGGDGDDVFPKKIVDEHADTIWRVGLSSTAIRFGQHIHAGGTLEGAYTVLAGDRFRLELGLAHDMARGDEMYAYSSTIHSRFLFRERLTLGLRGPESAGFRPGATLSLGVIPLKAATLGVGFGLDIPLKNRLFLGVQGNGTMALWEGEESLLDESWDLSASAGIGLNL